MAMKAKQFAVTAALALLAGEQGVTGMPAPETSATQETKPVATQSKFYCNTKALNSAERARHKQLTDKLIAARKEVVETEKGYEFQYAPSDVSLPELSEWVAAESKCCPFFDFHIDLERQGSLLCLRLTGDEGIKAFILAEFEGPRK